MEPSNQFTSVLHAWAQVFMRRSMHEFFLFIKQSGLSMTQLNTLMRLHHQGDCGVSDIGDHLGVTRAAASQLIDRLVLQGLLDRSEDPTDRRVKKVAITPQGRALIEAGIEARRRWMEELTTALTPGDQELITRALTLLTQAAHRLDPTATPEQTI